MSITPPQLQPQADFKRNPSIMASSSTPTNPSWQKRATYPRTSPPSRAQTPPTPELTFTAVFSGTPHNLGPPTPLDLLAAPRYPSPTPTRTLTPTPTLTTHPESNHGSPIVSPYATSSSSSSSSSSSLSRSFESISLRSLPLSSEAQTRETDDDDDNAILPPPAPAFLREHSGAPGEHTQGRMLWRSTLTPTTQTPALTTTRAYVPYPRGAKLPFAILEEEEPPEESFSDHDHDRDHESEEYYSVSESGSVSGQERERVKEVEVVRESGSEEAAGFEDKKEKERKRRSLGKRIKRMFVEKLKV